jgi:hypothetical protein
MHSLCSRAGLARALCALLTISGAAVAQTTGTVNPTAAQAGSPGEKEPPPGGCMPIGLTASGEVVFPFQCKDFLERQRSVIVKSPTVEPGASKDKSPDLQEKPADAGPLVTDGKQAEDKPTSIEAEAVGDKPVNAEQKSEHATPAVAEGKSAAENPDNVSSTTSKPAEASTKAPLLKRAELEARQLSVGPPGCTHFRTYDPASETYRSYHGERRRCR